MLDIRQTIEPKSDQLNADDLIAGQLTVTVRHVKQGPSREQPIEIVIDGHRPYRPCKSMRRVLVACWGDQGKDWEGRSMRLYADPSVKFGGVAVGGIRISHLSDIDEQEKHLMLTTTRSKRAPFIVKRMTDLPAEYPAAEFERNVEKWAAAINGGKLTVQDVIQRAMKTGRLSADQIAVLERKAEAERDILRDER